MTSHLYSLLTIFMKLTEYASKKIEKMTENKHLSINNKEEEIKKED